MSHTGSLVRVLAVVTAVVVGLPAPVRAQAQAKCLVLDPELQGSYEGGCADGKAEGQGTAKGSAMYTGGFHLGKKHGRGAKTWPWGDRYEGDFAEDHKHGWGIYTWGARSLYAGDRYEGGFAGDQRNGVGVYVWASGDSYAGPWKDDRVAGRATPMMIARFRATNASLEAIGKPGVRVCHESAIGADAKNWTEGEIQGVNPEAQLISVKVVRLGSSQPVVAGVRLAAGETVWDDPLHWIPCN